MKNHNYFLNRSVYDQNYIKEYNFLANNTKTGPDNKNIEYYDIYPPAYDTSWINLQTGDPTAPYYSARNDLRLLNIPKDIWNDTTQILDSPIDKSASIAMKKTINDLLGGRSPDDIPPGEVCPWDKNFCETLKTIHDADMEKIEWESDQIGESASLDTASSLCEISGNDQIIKSKYEKAVSDEDRATWAKKWEKDGPNGRCLNYLQSIGITDVDPKHVFCKNDLGPDGIPLCGMFIQAGSFPIWIPGTPGQSKNIAWVCSAERGGEGWTINGDDGSAQCKRDLTVVYIDSEISNSTLKINDITSGNREMSTCNVNKSKNPRGIPQCDSNSKCICLTPLTAGECNDNGNPNAQNGICWNKDIHGPLGGSAGAAANNKQWKEIINKNFTAFDDATANITRGRLIMSDADFDTIEASSMWGPGWDADELINEDWKWNISNEEIMNIRSQIEKKEDTHIWRREGWTDEQWDKLISGCKKMKLRGENNTYPKIPKSEQINYCVGGFIPGKGWDGTFKAFCRENSNCEGGPFTVAVDGPTNLITHADFNLQDGLLDGVEDALTTTEDRDVREGGTYTKKALSKIFQENLCQTAAGAAEGEMRHVDWDLGDDPYNYCAVITSPYCWKQKKIATWDDDVQKFTCEIDSGYCNTSSTDSWKLWNGMTHAGGAFLKCDPNVQCCPINNDELLYDPSLIPYIGLGAGQGGLPIKNIHGKNNSGPFTQAVINLEPLNSDDFPWAPSDDTKKRIFSYKPYGNIDFTPCANVGARTYDQSPWIWDNPSQAAKCATTTCWRKNYNNGNIKPVDPNSKDPKCLLGISEVFELVYDKESAVAVIPDGWPGGGEPWPRMEKWSGGGVYTGCCMHDAYWRGDKSEPKVLADFDKQLADDLYNKINRDKLINKITEDDETDTLLSEETERIKNLRKREFNKAVQEADDHIIRTWSITPSSCIVQDGHTYCWEACTNKHIPNFNPDEAHPHFYNKPQISWLSCSINKEKLKNESPGSLLDMSDEVNEELYNNCSDVENSWLSKSRLTEGGIAYRMMGAEDGNDIQGGYCCLESIHPSTISSLRENGIIETSTPNTPSSYMGYCMPKELCFVDTNPKIGTASQYICTDRVTPGEFASWETVEKADDKWKKMLQGINELDKAMEMAGKCIPGVSSPASCTWDRIQAQIDSDTAKGLLK